MCVCVGVCVSVCVCVYVGMCECVISSYDRMIKQASNLHSSLLGCNDSTTLKRFPYT